MNRNAGYRESEATANKQRALRDVLDRMSFTVSKVHDRHPNKGWPYWFIDMNAGPGASDTYGDGSPLIAAKTLATWTVPHRLIVCEFVAETRAALETNLGHV